MAACAQCGRETSLLYGDGRRLCWLCSSRARIAAAAPSRPADAPAAAGEDRRAWERYPVQIHMKFYYGQSDRSTIIFPGTAVNLSAGGMCVEWTACQECRGYQAGGVHPDCIFAGFAFSQPDAQPLSVALYLADDDVVALPARVVFIMKRAAGAEYLGLAFADLDAGARQRVEQILAAVSGDG